MSDVHSRSRTFSIMDEQILSQLVRSSSCDSEDSNYIDAESSLEDDEDDILDGECVCYMDTDEDINDEYSANIHPDLYTDLESFIRLYGEKCVQWRVFEPLDEIDIDLQIPLGFLDETTAEAWKVNSKELLTVRLRLSLSRYLKSSFVPKVEVFQGLAKEKFGFGMQIRRILENFLESNWVNLYDEYTRCQQKQEEMKKSQTYPVDIKDIQRSEHDTQEMVDSVSDESVKKLVEMGFALSLARNALIITQGDTEAATEMLLNRSVTPRDEAVLAKDASLQGKDVEKTGQGNSENLSVERATDNTTIKVGRHTPKRQHSHSSVLSRLKKIFPKPKFTRSTSMMHNSVCGDQLEDLNLMPLSTLQGKNAKIMPTIDDGLLVQIFRYTRQRIPTINEYCVICDELHVFQNGALLKPAVCTRELCVFAFQEFGLMADAAEDIATGAEVVDLLINMTLTACKSSRRTDIFDPFPTIVHPKDPCTLLFDPKHQDFDAALKVLEAIPPVSSLAKLTASLKQKLDANDPAIYLMIQWIITSNRSHIVKLPSERQIDFMCTPHQFLLLSSPPAKEIIFQEAKKQYGSTFAFHGSGIENWHSIIRNGLVNASGTKLQINGAAYGKGIYLSPQISTSMGYSRMGYGSHSIKKGQSQEKTKPRFLTGKNITCIAICEVITKHIKKNGAIWVCPEQDHVCTRFFFIYEDGQVCDLAIDTQIEKYLNHIKKACAYRGY